MHLYALNTMREMINNLALKTFDEMNVDNVTYTKVIFDLALDGLKEA